MIVIVMLKRLKVYDIY